MSLDVQVRTGNLRLGDEQKQRIQHQLGTLEKRLANFDEPLARLTLREHNARRTITADLKITPGPKLDEIVSHQEAETPDHAVRLAVEDVERQLERFFSALRGEQTFGVPSRRLPSEQRPHPLPAKS